MRERTLRSSHPQPTGKLFHSFFRISSHTFGADFAAGHRPDLGLLLLDMPPTKHDLQVVRRHVRQAKGCVAQQRLVIAALELQGRSTKLALELLAGFEQTLSDGQAHLDRLQAE